jgi:hypothetical protein
MHRTGDGRFVDYNEPEAMCQYALAQGVPDADIVLDYVALLTAPVAAPMTVATAHGTSFLLSHQPSAARSQPLSS